MKCISHLTFKCIIDCWGACSDAEMPGLILPCIVVATHGFSVTKSKQTSRRKNRSFKLD